MPRRARVILPGFPHHVTHRGNRGADIFRDNQDRHFYRSRLSKALEKYEVDLYSYSLMTNHVHHIAVPPSKEALSCCLHDAHGSYVDYFNRKYGLSGHLWQERYYACALDEAHLWNAVRYVEQNAVVAKMVARAEDYRWSSAAAHCGLREDFLLRGSFPPAGLVPDWSQWLSVALPDQEVDKIREHTLRGVPCASEAFLRKLESQLGIPLLPRKRGGRPRQDRQEEGQGRLVFAR